MKVRVVGPKSAKETVKEAIRDDAAAAAASGEEKASLAARVRELCDGDRREDAVALVVDETGMEPGEAESFVGVLTG